MIKFNTETDARLQPGEDEGKLDCGCILFYDEFDCACIRMCKLHKTAPKLLASLRDVVVWTQTHQRGECRLCCAGRKKLVGLTGHPNRREGNKSEINNGRATSWPVTERLRMRRDLLRLQHHPGNF